MSELVVCTTYARKKRHLADPADQLCNDYSDLPGRRFRTLCGNWGPDQQRCDAYYRTGEWSWNKPLVVADLPSCRQCDKAAAARGRPS